MRNLLFFSSVLCFCPFVAAQAHPHLFVGVDVTVILNNNAPTAIRLEWEYDEFFSLLLTADLGIDLDGDLELTPEELKVLTASVADWPDDFGGDLEVTQAGQPVPLGPRTAHGMTYADGLIRESHERPIPRLSVGEEGFVVRVFDPFYYVSYSLNGPVQFEGEGNCSAVITPPDLNAAYSIVDELLYGRAVSDVGMDEEFPEVGVKFAETISITCA